MIVPSIDLMEGAAVQLVGGRDKEIDAGDPFPIAEKFARAGQLAVIDLDAAIGTGQNTDLIKKLVASFPCRVGGGIRTLEKAMEWLDSGAQKIILGTAACPELLERLPKKRVIAALDAINGEVVVEGWRKKTGVELWGSIGELSKYVGGFLITFVEREGRMKGIDLDQVKRAVEAAGDVRVTVAGGVATAEEIGLIDEAGADVQVGMALYSGAVDLGDCITAPMKSDRSDGLWPTVVVSEGGRVLGLVWSNAKSVREAVRTGTGVYWSRRRGLWRKGESSGDVQELLKIDLDCDRDALRFTVRQTGRGFCHTGEESCFGEIGGLARLEKTLVQRMQSAPEGSYTRRLFKDPWLLGEKLKEEAGELASAEKRNEVIHEAADFFYFGFTAMTRGGVTLADVEKELDQRALRVSRRVGDAKTERS